MSKQINDTLYKEICSYFGTFIYIRINKTGEYEFMVSDDEVFDYGILKDMGIDLGTSNAGFYIVFREINNKYYYIIYGNYDDRTVYDDLNECVNDALEQTINKIDRDRNILSSNKENIKLREKLKDIINNK